jgi:hypothetical protein
MMSALNWYSARAGSTHNAVALNGMVRFGFASTHAKIRSNTVDGDKRSPGPVNGVTVVAEFRDKDQAAVLIAARTANFIGKYLDDAGANRKVTLKNAFFTDVGQVTTMERGASGDTPVWSASGELDLGADSLATLIVDAVDT